MNRVYIGDPCYVIGDDNWQNFCDMIDNNDNSQVIFDFMGHNIFVMQTKYGDGVYELFDDKYTLIGKLCVDSGLLCVMSFDGVQKIDGIDDGCVIEIKDFNVDNVYSDENATLFAGKYFVKTDYEDDEDDEDDYDESYDYDDDESYSD